MSYLLKAIDLSDGEFDMILVPRFDGGTRQQIELFQRLRDIATKPVLLFFANELGRNQVMHCKQLEEPGAIRRFRERFELPRTNYNVLVMNTIPKQDIVADFFACGYFDLVIKTGVSPL